MDPISPLNRSHMIGKIEMWRIFKRKKQWKHLKILHLYPILGNVVVKTLLLRVTNYTRVGP